MNLLSQLMAGAFVAFVFYAVGHWMQIKAPNRTLHGLGTFVRWSGAACAIVLVVGAFYEAVWLDAAYIYSKQK